MAPPMSVKVLLVAVATMGEVVISAHAPVFKTRREKTRYRRPTTDDQLMTMFAPTACSLVIARRDDGLFGVVPESTRRCS